MRRLKHSLQNLITFARLSGTKMRRLKQSFKNSTNSPQFINLELSTSRFRLNPGEELILHYDAGGRAADSLGATLRIEFITGFDGIELVVWTAEDQMFFPDGRAAPQDFGRA